MSFHEAKKYIKKVQPNQARDWFIVIDQTLTALTVDVFTEYQCLGLDFFINNKSTTDTLNVSFDKKTSITIPINGSMSLENTLFSLVVITGTSPSFEAVISGVKL